MGRHRKQEPLFNDYGFVVGWYEPNFDRVVKANGLLCISDFVTKQ